MTQPQEQQDDRIVPFPVRGRDETDDDIRDQVIWMTATPASPDLVADLFQVPSVHRLTPLSGLTEPRFAYQRLLVADRILQSLMSTGSSGIMVLNDPEVRIERPGVLRCLRMTEAALTKWASALKRALDIPALGEWIKSAKDDDVVPDPACANLADLITQCERHERQIERERRQIERDRRRNTGLQPTKPRIPLGEHAARDLLESTITSPTQPKRPRRAPGF